MHYNDIMKWIDEKESRGLMSQQSARRMRDEMQKAQERQKHCRESGRIWMAYENISPFISKAQMASQSPHKKPCPKN